MDSTKTPGHVMLHHLLPHAETETNTDYCFVVIQNRRRFCIIKNDILNGNFMIEQYYRYLILMLKYFENNDIYSILRSAAISVSGEKCLNLLNRTSLFLTEEMKQFHYLYLCARAHVHATNIMLVFQSKILQKPNVSD